jgi:DNA repair exonuclease SbcCD ATPase subunit
MIDFDQERTDVEQIRYHLRHAKQSIREEKQALKRNEEHLARAQEAQGILQLIAQAIQQKAHERIAGVVSSCLSAVFDEPYIFKIEFERKRGRTEAKLTFCRDGLEIDPLTASGGGVIDVASFALRAACLMLHRPRLSKIIVLDEPFKFLSVQYRENARLMLEKLSSDLGLQFIVVTHSTELATGKIISL